MPKIKNILIFVAIAAIFVAIYFFYIRKSSDSDKNLVSAPATAATPATGAPVAGGADSKIAQEFLSLLLSVKNIKLDDSIFSEEAFVSLHDSSITLTPDGTEGRVNPFAPLGTDVVAALPPTCTALQFLNIATNTCVARATCELPKVLNTTTNTCVNPPTR